MRAAVVHGGNGGRRGGTAGIAVATLADAEILNKTGEGHDGEVSIRNKLFGRGSLGAVQNRSQQVNEEVRGVVEAMDGGDGGW